MGLSPQDILNIASQDYILQNTDLYEQTDFIRDQIRDPFDSGSANYFKRLRKLVSGEKLDSICNKMLSDIEDRYPSMEFDLSGYDKPVADVFSPVYKFFVKNIQTLVYRFLREYITVSKNRKMLVAEYLGSNLPVYPKEQYGKKEYYILLNKLPAIILNIAKDEDITLAEFISYLERAGETSMCVEETKKLLDDGILCERGVVQDIFDLFLNSSKCDTTTCKLQIDITQNIIIPYLEKNGLMSLRLPPVQPVDDETDDEEDDSDDDA